jgi:hypothetical protein
MQALQWFMAEHSSILQDLQPKYLKLRLARFVLKNNYVECKGIKGSFLQRISTAMSTSFSVQFSLSGWKHPSSMNFNGKSCCAVYRRHFSGQAHTLSYVASAKDSGMRMTISN